MTTAASRGTTRVDFIGMSTAELTQPPNSFYLAHPARWEFFDQDDPTLRYFIGPDNLFHVSGNSGFGTVLTAAQISAGATTAALNASKTGFSDPITGADIPLRVLSTAEVANPSYVAPPVYVGTWAGRPDAAGLPYQSEAVFTDLGVAGHRLYAAGGQWLSRTGPIMYTFGSTLGSSTQTTAGATKTDKMFLLKLPGGLIGPNGYVEVDIEFTSSGGTTTKTLGLAIGDINGTALNIGSFGLANSSFYRMDCMFRNKGYTNVNVSFTNSATGFGAASNPQNGAIDTTVDMDLYAFASWFPTNLLNESAAVTGLTVRVFPGGATQADPVQTVLMAYFGGWAVGASEPHFYYPTPWGESDGTAYAANNIHLKQYKERIPSYWATSGANDVTATPANPIAATLGNEDDQSVIDNHLVLADQAGVTAFATCWYGDDQLNYAAVRFAASTSPAACQWFLLFATDPNPMDGTTSNRAYLFERIRRAGLRMRGPRYWSKNGRPGFGIFSTPFLDDVIRGNKGFVTRAAYTPSTADRNNLVANIRNIIANVLNGDTTGGIVAGDTAANSATTVALGAGASTTPCHLIIMDVLWGKYAGVNATTEYNVLAGTFSGVVRAPHSYAELRVAAQQYWSYASANAISVGSKHYPTAMTSYSHLPWGASADPGLDNCLPATASERRQHMLDARAWASRTECDSTTFVCAFNEHGEGSFCNPTPLIGTDGLTACKLLSALGPQFA